MKILYEILRLFYTPKCEHHWATLLRENIEIIGNGSISSPLGDKVGVRYVREQECTKCGENRILSTKITG
jgi:hypothetical protein